MSRHAFHYLLRVKINLKTQTWTHILNGGSLQTSNEQKAPDVVILCEISI